MITALLTKKLITILKKNGGKRMKDLEINIALDPVTDGASVIHVD